MGVKTDTQWQQEDPLSPARLQARAAQIHSIAEADQIERHAMLSQQQADQRLSAEQAPCQRRFLVNRCLEQVAQRRNNTWDAAQIDRSAARLYLRQQEAAQKKTELTTRLSQYRREEAAKAPLRAENARRYRARQQTHQEQLRQYQKAQTDNAAQRAQKVEDFNDKVKRIETIKQKRIENAQKTPTPLP